MGLETTAASLEGGSRPSPVVLFKPRYSWLRRCRVKCRHERFGDFWPFDWLGRISVQLERVIAGCPEALKLARQRNRMLRFAFCVGFFGHLILCLAMVLAALDYAGLSRGPGPKIWPLCFMAGLFLYGYFILLAIDSWRCFNKMIEVYNQSIGASSPQKEQ